LPIPAQTNHSLPFDRYLVTPADPLTPGLLLAPPR
jgi:hypothetical protein